MSDAPNIIYLQWYGCDRLTVVNDDDTETPIPLEDHDEPYEVTWEHERIYNTDVPYQRADLAESDDAILHYIFTLEAEITRLRELVAGMDDGGRWYSQASMDAVIRERDKYREVLELTLKSIRDFRVWFEDEYMQHVEVDDPLLQEVARLGLTGRAESLLEDV